jgi:hypothetical protein
VNRQSGKPARIGLLVMAVMLFVYTVYGISHGDLYMLGRLSGLSDFHGRALWFIAGAYFCCSFLWALKAVMGNRHDKGDHSILDMAERSLFYVGLFFFLIGIGITAFTPKEKPTYHPGDSIRVR